MGCMDWGKRSSTIGNPDNPLSFLGNMHFSSWQIVFLLGNANKSPDQEGNK
jgi:hypothetical protein